MKFRNTYQVPSGQVVSVDTPQGEKKYTGGQYVPPEQLANARVAQSGDKSKKGQAPPGPTGPAWDEVLQQFKNTDVSNNISLNRASYNIKQFLSILINTSSNNVTPACKFGAELTLANIMNSLPGLKDIIAELQLNIHLINTKDDPATSNPVVGKNFVKVGEISFKDNTIKYWEHENKPADILENVSKYLGAKVGIFIIRHIYQMLDAYKAQEKDINQKMEQLQIVAKRKVNDFSSAHKGKPPEEGQDEELDKMMEELRGMSLQKQTIDTLAPLVNQLETAVKKEGGFNKYLQNMINENLREGTIHQFCRVISNSNAISLGGQNTFASSMEQLSGTHPETLSTIKQIIDTLTQISQESQQPEE